MSAPAAHTAKAKPRKRQIRLNKTDTAAQAIGPLTAGIEVFCLTFGQFSLIDAIEHVVHSVHAAPRKAFQ